MLIMNDFAVRLFGVPCRMAGVHGDERVLRDEGGYSSDLITERGGTPIIRWSAAAPVSELTRSRVTLMLTFVSQLEASDTVFGG